MLLCAGNADADADVTCAATAANPDSYVEAMTGELASKWLDAACKQQAACSCAFSTAAAEDA
jgi:hypothetical protein